MASSSVWSLPAVVIAAAFWYLLLLVFIDVLQCERAT
jgi:hypothetical protein